MILNHEDIKRLYEAGSIFIDPYYEERVGPNSYDFRLGNYFYMLKYDDTEPVYVGPVYIPDDEYLFLPSGQTILAITREIIGARANIVCQIHARSSVRRMGISICDDAGLGDIGYIDHWTLELTANVSPYGVVKTGQRIGQMLFNQAGFGVNEEWKYDGQYKRTWPENMIPKNCRVVEPKSYTYRKEIFMEEVSRPGQEQLA